MVEWKEIKGDPVIFWNPDPENKGKDKGQKIEGTIIKLNPEGTYGLTAYIKTEEGQVYGTPSNRVLQNRLSQIKVGDYVEITYDGNISSKKGLNATKLFTVKIRV